MQKRFIFALSALLCLQEGAAKIVPAPSENSALPYGSDRPKSILKNGPKNKVILRAPPKDPLLAQVEQIDNFAKMLTRAPIRNDCFFVTTAHLTGVSIQDLSKHAGVDVPPPKRPGDLGPDGVTLKNMVKAFDKLGLRYRIWKYGWSPDWNGRGEALALPPRNLPRVVGVAYRRPNNGGGHVVVCRNPGTPYRRYIDYQADHKGLDVTAEVRTSRIYAYFHVDKDASKGEFFKNQLEAINQMEIDEANLNLPGGSQDEPMEVVYDDQLPLLTRGDYGGLNCPALLATLSAPPNMRAKRSIEDGNFLRTRADGDCDMARETADQNIKKDKELAKQEHESTTPGQEEMPETPKEEGTPPKEGEPTIDSGKEVAAIDEAKVAELVESASKKEFSELVEKRGLVDLVKKKWSLDVHEFRVKRLGYQPFTPASLKSGSQALQNLKKATKGGLNVLGLGLWIAGTAEAFASDTATDWDKAAAAGSIVPFVGCGLSAKADADKGGTDWVDTTLCVTADALTLSPAAPLGILLHIYRFFRKLGQPEPLPKFEHMQGVRDSTWTSILNEKVYTQLYSDNSFQERLKDSLLFTDLAVISRAAQRISLANPDVLSAMEASTSDMDKAQTQSLSLSAANEIREGISNETIRTQRDFLLHLPDQLLTSAEPYTKSIAEQFKKEFTAELASDQMALKYTEFTQGRYVSGVPIVPPTNNFPQVQSTLKNMGERLNNSPLRMPNRFDIAYIIGQSKGLQGIDPLILSPRDFLKTEEPKLPESDRDSLLLFHTLEVSRLLHGEKTEDELDSYWPSSGNTSNLRPLQILVAIKYGKTFEEVKMKNPQKDQDEFHSLPSLPHVKGLLDELQSAPYLSIVLGLGEEIINNLPKDARYKTYNGLFKEQAFIDTMLQRAIQIQAENGTTPAHN